MDEQKNEEIFRMWTEKIYLPSYEKKHAELGTPDFDVITRHGYQATTDLPMSLYFEQVYEKYPDCKFILTTRDDSEIWYRSWSSMIQATVGPTEAGSKLVRSAWRHSIYFRWLFSLMNKDDSFLTAPGLRVPQDKDKAIESYEEHNARVRAIIPKSQLLEYNVKQGWEPLCKFLEIGNCPMEKPFPKSNLIHFVKSHTASLSVMPLIFILLLLCIAPNIFTRLFRTSAFQWMRCHLSGAARVTKAAKNE